MCNFTLLVAVTLAFALAVSAINILDPSRHETTKGLLVYEDSEMDGGAKHIFEHCEVWDLEGEIVGSYQMNFQELDYAHTTTGCALLYKSGSCEGTPAKKLPIGKGAQSQEFQFTEADGHYWGTKYSSSC